MWFKLLLAFLFNCILITQSNASSLIEEAYRYFQDEDYQSAIILYSNANGYLARMGEGSCAYRINDFEYAIRQFTSALLNAQLNPDKHKALYNLANSYYKNQEFIKAIETYKYLLTFTPNSEQTQGNLWSAQSMLIDKIKNNTLYENKESTNYQQIDDETELESEEKFSHIEKIGYLRTLIGDRVAEGELNAIAEKGESVNKLVARAKQIKNYLTAIKKIEFVEDHPIQILKSIIALEMKK
ncbi:hypothetical protein MNBD_GAMMA22-1766 [hydrothermal vent metagenome]|uniref:Uncharacterized protein n=1 Tax=hydrothermal vent metagenome TaxID=652676 RepID=A0A3B0ZGL4_9ZZZZ